MTKTSNVQLVQNRTLKKVKTIHASSYGPNDQAKNIILTTLHRINANCSNNFLLTKSTYQYLYSQTFNGYNHSHFKQALYHMKKSSNKAIWKIIFKNFNKYCKNNESFRRYYYLGNNKIKPYYKLYKI